LLQTYADLLTLSPADFLSLWGNDLTGRIPPGIDKLTNLSEFFCLFAVFFEFFLSLIDITNCSTATLWLFNNNLTEEFTCPTDIEDCRISCDPCIECSPCLAALDSTCNDIEENCRTF
jgi:hypothetical protein